MSKSKKYQTVGYWYYMGMHLGLCHGPVDEISKIEADDKEAWTGSQSASGYFYINKPELFGGESKDGGLSMGVNVCMGESTQQKNSYLVSKLGSVIPAFRGICALVTSGYITANTTYIKPWAVTLKRIKKGWKNNTVWYEEKANIGIDMNPAHIIYECLTNDAWGMGYSTSAIDNDNFIYAADYLYNESFGLSLMWNQQSTIQQFIQIICDHIGAVLKVDPITGKFQLKLIRADYDPDDLVIFNQTNIVELQSFQRAGWGETVNEVTIVYTDPDTRKETSTTVHDLANIQAQGQVVNQKTNYTGICRHDLASKVAMRDLISRSTPLSKLKFTVNRTAWNLVQGDVFKFTWSKLGINNLILRVMSVSTGTLENGLITVDAVEDVFGLPSVSYAANQGNQWQNPTQDAIASPLRKFVEATYYDIATTMTSADLAATDPNEGYAVMYAKGYSNVALNYLLKTRISGVGDYVEVNNAPHCPTAYAWSFDALEEYTTTTINNIVGDLSRFVIGNYLICDDEYMRVDVIDTINNEITVARGVLDTVPQLHDANAPIYFAEGFGAVDPTAYVAGEHIQAKVITRTNSSILDIDDAPVDTLTINARHYKPYPPAKIRINTSFNPSFVISKIIITWKHRNRLQQTVDILAQDDDSVTPEAGTTYTINIYKNLLVSPVLCRTLTGLTGTSYTYPINEEFADCGGAVSYLTVEIFSVRDGIESWQKHRFTFERIYIANDKDLTTPPASPAIDDTYIVAASPTGAWSGHATHIAIWNGSTWDFYAPITDWRFFVSDELVYYRFNGTAWVIL